MKKKPEIRLLTVLEKLYEQIRPKKNADFNCKVGKEGGVYEVDEENGE